jgi:rhodanese-related sulfurtransferase
MGAMDSPERFDINDLLAEARSHLNRVSPEQAEVMMQEGALILDTRQDTDRWADGVIPGSLHTPRTVLEWVVDPASGNPDTVARSLAQPLVVVCNEGYSSSLAAHALQRIGFFNATDMIGGFHGWRTAGLPIHHHREGSPE